MMVLVLAGGVLTILGTGGGGGGGDNGTPGSISYVGNTEPAIISATNAARLVGNIVGASATSEVIVVPAGATLNSPYGSREGSSQSGLAHRLNAYLNDTLMRARTQISGAGVTVAVIPVDEILPCDDGGSVHVSGTLNDNGTGTLNAIYNNCRTGEDTLNGEATLRIDAFDLTYFIPTDATFSFPILTLTTPTQSQSVSGTLRDQVNITANTETLTINMVTRDDLSGDTSKAENFVAIAVFDNIFFPSFYTETISGRVFDSIHGYVDITTVTPLIFNSINQFFPDSGQLRLTGASNSSIRVTAVSAMLVLLELDLNGDSTYDTTATLKWTDLGGPVGADLGDTDGDGMHNSWETVNGLDPNSADADIDSDGDGFRNLDEYLAGTDPGNPASIPPSADLTISITGSLGPVAIGSTFSYYITVVNFGPVDASDVVMTDTLPPGLSLVSATTDIGSCSGTNTVTCNLGILVAGSTGSITLSVTASAEGVHTNSTTVTSSTLDGDLANNTASITTTVGSSAGSLQSLIDAAADNATIFVDPGLYVGGIDFNGKNITIESTAGPATTILHGDSGTAVYIGPGGAIKGFTITGAVASFGAVVEASGAGSIISGNIFDGNAQAGGGSGAAIGGNNASPTIERNLFRNNSCDTQAGVVTFANSSSPTIVNNIFENNPCRSLNLTLPSGNTPRVINNTFVGNSVAIRVDRRVSQVTQIYRNNILFQNGIGLEVEFGTESDNPVWENNLVFANTTDYQGITDQTGLSGNISANPMLLGPDNYHLLGTSPAIDAGNAIDAPAIDFDGTSRPLDGDGNGTSAFDIGAFEFTPP